MTTSAVQRPLVSKVALVTGASRGIGRAIALELAKAGAELSLCATTMNGLAQVVKEAEALGARVCATACDVGDPVQVDMLVSRTFEAFGGRVDVLVNNAGIVQRAPISEVSDAEFDRVLRVNLSAPFYLARRLVPGMVGRRSGRIVNVSSISSTLGSPRTVSYNASKWGVNGLTRSLAEELRGTGVMVCAVLPGSVDTDMLKGSGFDPQMSAEQVAAVVRFLAAEAPEPMTGSLVEVFG